MTNERKKIYSDRQYLVGMKQGISGFPKPSVLAIVSGVRYRRDFYGFDETPHEGNLNVRQFRQESDIFQNQPLMSYDKACQWVKANPYQAAVIVPEETEVK